MFCIDLSYPRIDLGGVIGHVYNTGEHGEVILWLMGKIDGRLTTTKHNYARTECTSPISDGLLSTGHDGRTGWCHAVIMWAMVSQINSVFIVWSTVCSSADQTKYQSSALQALCEGNPSVTGGFPSHRASNTENGSIWWHHNAQTGGRRCALWVDLASKGDSMASGLLYHGS